MDEELYKRKMQSLCYCDRLLAELAHMKEDTYSFFGGDIYDAYIKANDRAIEKVTKVRNRIRNIQ